MSQILITTFSVEKKTDEVYKRNLTENVLMINYLIHVVIHVYVVSDGY